LHGGGWRPTHLAGGGLAVAEDGAVGAVEEVEDLPAAHGVVQARLPGVPIRRVHRGEPPELPQARPGAPIRSERGAGAALRRPSPSDGNPS